MLPLTFSGSFCFLIRRHPYAQPIATANGTAMRLVRVADRKSNVSKNPGNGSLACPHCAKRFISKSKLVRARGSVISVQYQARACFVRRSTQFSGHLAQCLPLMLTILRACVCIFQERHLVVHTKEKPYQCTACGVRFTQKPTLRTHQLKYCEKPPRGKKAAFADTTSGNHTKG